MDISEVEVYRCPRTLSKLTLNETKMSEGKVVEGTLTNKDGTEYSICNSIPDFTWPKELMDVDEETRIAYEKLALEYDKYADLPFQTFKQSNHDVREKITAKLNLQPNSKVLDIGAGDGRGAEYILKYIPDGELYFQELSESFLNSAVNRLKNYQNQVRYSIANASYLSFPDNYFDCAHHFGGISTFAEKERCLEEMSRVVKPGGKIVIGDEGIGPWLRETEMAKIMINSNPLIGIDVPMEALPVSARNVVVEWIMMGAFYLIDFEVGEGAPEPDYFVNIPSARGGNHWTRYHGNLEGVSDEVKKVALKASKAAGISMHDWLEKVISEAVSNKRE